MTWAEVRAKGHGLTQLLWQWHPLPGRLLWFRSCVAQESTPIATWTAPKKVGGNIAAVDTNKGAIYWQSLKRVHRVGRDDLTLFWKGGAQAGTRAILIKRPKGIVQLEMGQRVFIFFLKIHSEHPSLRRRLCHPSLWCFPTIKPPQPSVFN